MRKSTSNSSLVAQLTNEVQNGVVLSRAYDTLNRPTGYSLEDSLRSLRSLRLEYSYDTLGRFSGVGFNAEPQSRRGFEYQYLAGSDLVSGYVASAGDSGGVASRPLLVRSVAYEPRRDLIAAVVPASSPDDWDEMSAVTGSVFVAQNPEQFTYDADGNMLTDGRFRYTWNGENRLVRAQELVAPTNRHPYTVSYAYDHKGRMVSKRITENDGHDTLVKSIAYVWDGWNVIRETVTNPSTLQPFNSSTDNVWGLDLDGTMQGAGGMTKSTLEKG